MSARTQTAGRKKPASSGLQPLRWFLHTFAGDYISQVRRLSRPEKSLALMEKTMAIFKANVANQFTQIPNETLQDPSLSFEAKGLLALILSLPSDWEIHKTWLQEQAANCGRDKLKRLIKELTDAGYMVKKAKQDEGGKMAGWDWFVYPLKQPQPRNGKGSTDGLKTRQTVLPSVGKAPTTNKHLNKENK